MAVDWSGVGLKFDKASYNPGDVVTATLTGQAVDTTTKETVVNVTGTAKASDGSTGTVTGQWTFVQTVPTPESVTLTAMTDDAGRTYKVDATGLFATTTA